MKVLILHWMIICLELPGQQQVLAKKNMGIAAMGTGLNEYVHNFSVEYHTIAISDFTGIHKFLMKKHNIR